jgi:hypothetical protein
VIRLKYSSIYWIRYNLELFKKTEIKRCSNVMKYDRQQQQGRVKLTGSPLRQPRGQRTADQETQMPCYERVYNHYKLAWKQSPSLKTEHKQKINKEIK